MIAGGTVSFSDMYFFPAKTIESVLNAGMKANISRPVQAFKPADPGAQTRIRESIELFDAYHGAGNGRVLVDFCIHAEYTCNEETVAQYSSLCNERHGNMHIHLSETKKEHDECIAKYGKTPARWFYDLGAFDSRAFAAHCVTLEEEDMQILKEKNVSIVHNPTSNLKLGSGFAPIPKYLQMGFNVALGTDGAASNNTLNMFHEINLLALIHKGTHADAVTVTSTEAVTAATIGGAKALDLPVGALAVGKKADITLLDLSCPQMNPPSNLISSLAFSANGSEVDTVIVNGKVLLEKRRLTTIDEERVIFETNRIFDRVKI
jgi:5-methylthioadenosine/S-adenosylhomocysteine deaminase